jgi:hypothetical protein
MKICPSEYISSSPSFSFSSSRRNLFIQSQKRLEFEWVSSYEAVAKCEVESSYRVSEERLSHKMYIFCFVYVVEIRKWK